MIYNVYGGEGLKMMSQHQVDKTEQTYILFYYLPYYINILTATLFIFVLHKLSLFLLFSYVICLHRVANMNRESKRSSTNDRTNEMIEKSINYDSREQR